MVTMNRARSMLVAGLVLVIVSALGMLPTLAQESQMTWGVHVTLVPTWLDPGGQPSGRRSWFSTRSTMRW
jgi:hypothetical protein